jgi:putative transposase
MPRRRRTAPGGYVYHVLNRAAGRLLLFESPSDYDAFERLLSTGQHRVPMRIIAYCLMRNHWHLLLWPERDGAVTAFIHWVTSTHARRWALAHDAVGCGAVYQSRFKSIPVQDGEHLFRVWRYIERNPLRANLVTRAELWRWSSLGTSRFDRDGPPLTASPIQVPVNWVDHVNRPQTIEELAGIRQVIETGEPYGDPQWKRVTESVGGWRPQGRPKRGRTPFSRGSTEKGVRPLFTDS